MLQILVQLNNSALYVAVVMWEAVVSLLQCFMSVCVMVSSVGYCDLW